MDKKLSIITINRNNAEGLRKTIESVVNQTAFNKIEYIIIDGNSTDGSKEVIQDYADKLIYWVSEPDTGIYNAMNKGIKVATGEYCQFLNSGDWLTETDVTEKMLGSGAEEPILIGNMVKLFPNGKKLIDKGKRNSEISFISFYLGTLNHASAYIKRNLFDVFGMYDEELKIVSDWKWYLIVVGQNKTPVKNIDLDVAIFNTSGISHINPALVKAERNKVLKQIMPSHLVDELNLKLPEMEQLNRLKRYRISSKLTWIIDRVIFKLEKLGILHQ